MMNIESFSKQMDLSEAHEVVARLTQRMSAQVLGRDDVVELVLIALLSDGHVLLEDFPGSGKTTLAKALGESIIDDRAPEVRGFIEAFRRIQFTPDLLPGDVTGTTVFEPVSGRFDFRPGPVFAHVVLADEINRTSPKVQASLLEAMGEKQVTVDNQTHRLDDLFFVIATQNPLDLAGTYPLPVAQLDRFLFKIRMTHISKNAELEVLKTLRQRRQPSELPKVSRGELLGARQAIDSSVHVDPRIQQALVEIANNLRNDRRVLQGVSTRSLVLAIPALQCRAMMKGRDFVDGEDLHRLLPFVFQHRCEVSGGESEIDAVIFDAFGPVLERLATQVATKYA